jgi:phage baseplate assembly protein W
MSSLQQKSGPAFPFGRSIRSVLGEKTRRESIQTAVRLILETPKGSIPYAPNFGSHVPHLVFDPLDDTLLNLLIYYAVHDLEEQDTRIKVRSVVINIVAPHHVAVQLGYEDRNSPGLPIQKTMVDFSGGQ